MLQPFTEMLTIFCIWNHIERAIKQKFFTCHFTWRKLRELSKARGSKLRFDQGWYELWSSSKKAVTQAKISQAAARCVYKPCFRFAEKYLTNCYHVGNTLFILLLVTSCPSRKLWEQRDIHEVVTTWWLLRWTCNMAAQWRTCVICRSTSLDQGMWGHPACGLILRLVTSIQRACYNLYDFWLVVHKVATTFWIPGC